MQDFYLATVCNFFSEGAFLHGMCTRPVFSWGNLKYHSCAIISHGLYWPVRDIKKTKPRIHQFTNSPIHQFKVLQIENNILLIRGFKTFSDLFAALWICKFVNSWFHFFWCHEQVKCFLYPMTSQDTMWFIL